VRTADDEERHSENSSWFSCGSGILLHFVFGHSHLRYFLHVGDRMYISVQNIVLCILTLTLFVASV